MAMFPEYKLIKDFYGERRAARSNVPLINHIDEGLEILSELGASHSAKMAFCLHPLLQADGDLLEHWRKVSEEASPRAILLAMEYRRAANAYLCTPETDHYTMGDIERVVGLNLIPDVRLMLIADKRQNQKDFVQYHLATHPRSAQLEAYFRNWRAYLQDFM